MVEAHACHKHVMISGKVYRTVSDGCWSVPRRLDAMAEQRVARQVLSPMLVKAIRSGNASRFLGL